MTPTGVEGYHIGNRYKPRRHRRVSDFWSRVSVTAGGLLVLAAFLLLDAWLLMEVGK
jgi:ABC-type uncharacterized transport system permease subunit